MLSITEQIFGECPEQVSLEQMFCARERRAARQKRLIQKYRRPLISFTMNIAGPVKNSPTIERAFYHGLARLDELLEEKHIAVLCKETQRERSGCQALYAADAAAYELKNLCMRLEDDHPLGRLYDMDVISADGRPISREALGGVERGCILCHAQGHGCASRRTHSSKQLQRRTGEILYGYFLQKDAQTVMSLAADCLRLEARTSPKPGLVDMNNNGSHSDMDMDTMLHSVSAIEPYFKRFFEIGVKTAGEEAQSAFAKMRAEGLKAEVAMLKATGEVNTHKGAVFLLGTVCGVCGRLWKPSGLCKDAAAVTDMCAELTVETLRRELAALTPETAASFGEKLYVRHGIRGVRGQLMDGLPAVRDTALPCLRALTASGYELMPAGAVTLLHLIAEVPDTNMIRRGGPEAQRRSAGKAARLLRSGSLPRTEDILALDKEFISENLSPGGCADLLALTYFLFLLESGPPV